MIIVFCNKMKDDVLKPLLYIKREIISTLQIIFGIKKKKKKSFEVHLNKCIKKYFF
jgi:hypothetical protein